MPDKRMWKKLSWCGEKGSWWENVNENEWPNCDVHYEHFIDVDTNGANEAVESKKDIDVEVQLRVNHKRR